MPILVRYRTRPIGTTIVDYDEFKRLYGDLSRQSTQRVINDSA